VSFEVLSDTKQMIALEIKGDCFCDGLFSDTVEKDSDNFYANISVSGTDGGWGEG
jgi:hypothetical protein